MTPFSRAALSPIPARDELQSLPPSRFEDAADNVRGVSVEAVIDAYNELPPGPYRKALADMFGCHINTISTILRRSGIVNDNRGKP